MNNLGSYKQDAGSIVFSKTLANKPVNSPLSTPSIGRIYSSEQVHHLFNPNTVLTMRSILQEAHQARSCTGLAKM